MLGVSNYLQGKILNSLSYSKSGVVATSYNDDGIVRGQGHAIASSVTIAGSTTINFLLDLSGVDEDKFVFVLPVSVNSGTEDVKLMVYESTDYSGGTPVTTFNPNRNSSDTKQFAITAGATGSAKGSALIERHAFSSKHFSSESSSYSFLILDKTKNYLVELENLGNAATIVDYSTVIYES